jgi:hypothetical protein
MIGSSSGGVHLDCEFNFWVSEIMSIRMLHTGGSVCCTYPHVCVVFLPIFFVFVNS